MENRDINIGVDLSEDELMHYGRLGMKWGQHIYGKAKAAKTNRKRKKNLEKARQAKVDKAKAAAERQEAIRKGKIKPKDMTDDELRARTERLRAEKTYKELSAETKVVSKGRKYITDFAMGPGKKIFWDTSVDLAAQSFKTIGADRINKMFEKHGYGDIVVYTNNKRKS